MAKRKEDENDDELNRALAILISNTRSNKRPLPLTEIAKWLNVAVEKLGGYSAVAERIGLSPQMIRQFSYIERLAPSVQQLVASRKLDSVDAVAHLAMLPAKQQQAVAEALAAREIETSDVRAVAQLQRARYSDSIKEILERVKNSKTKREYIAEFVVRGSRNPERILKTFQKYISPKEIIRVDIDGALGKLVLTQTGKKELFKAARDLGTSINQVIPIILEG
jgi:DNA-binding transcriptional regulator YdaS (Cro superfamily)